MGTSDVNATLVIVRYLQ